LDKEKHNNVHSNLFFKLRVLPCKTVINTILKYKFWHQFMKEGSFFNARFLVPNSQEELT
jgi:hypothetical protein